MENSNRLEIQIKQIKSLLSEFRKNKMKCLQLCQKLNRDLPNLLQYEVMQVTCTRKIDTLDILGVIKLKKQLLKNLSEVSELERDMLYETQKNSFKKAMKVPLTLSRESVNDQQLGPFEIPSYNSKVQSNQNKVDRLANFILSLGKSMTILRKCILGEWEWDQQNFYKYEPEYLAVVQKIQQFKLRDEELVNIIERKYQKQLSTILSKGQKSLSQQQDFQIIKIPKRTIQRIIQKEKDKQFYAQQAYHPVSMIQPKRKTATKKRPLQRITEQKIIQTDGPNLIKHTSDTSLELNISNFQKHKTQSKVSTRLLDQTNEQPENDNYVYMVKRVSPDNHLNSSIISSMSSLRSMRKQVFEDDIWDQFEKI